MIFNGMIVTSLDKKIKGQVLAYDYGKDFASVYNWLDEKFVETKLSNLVETPLWELMTHNLIIYLKKFMS